MSRRASLGLSSGWKALAWVIALLLVLVLTAVLNLESYEWIPVVGFGAWLLTTAVVGALISSNRPENAVGALMIAAPLVIALGLFFEGYASYIYELGHHSLPFGRAAAWLTTWFTIPGFALFIHLLLRFPTGHVPSPRWIWASRLATTSLIVTTVGYALRPGPIDNVPALSNPLGSVAPRWVSELGVSVGDTLLPLAGFVAIASLFLRYRRAQGVERQQMKWFVAAVSIFPILFVVSQFVDQVGGSEDDYLGFIVIVVALLLIPLSMGVGILKHRLYDIDVVVNRALVYGTLTGILGGAYLGIVVVLQRFADSFTRDSDLAIAGSTLVVAALFRPLRVRVQAFIDRRFYRRKYDAAETLGEFSSRLRDQVDLDSLTQELVDVVGSTMQPAHASVWLREGATR
jgi:hypothetical protein